MSDPNHDGPYTCHGPMQPVRIEALGLGVLAYRCDCGIWRHALPTADARRRQVDMAMPALIEAHGLGARGDEL